MQEGRGAARGAGGLAVGRAGVLAQYRAQRVLAHGARPLELEVTKGAKRGQDRQQPVALGHNKYGSVQELRSTFSHTKSVISDFSLV